MSNIIPAATGDMEDVGSTPWTVTSGPGTVVNSVTHAQTGSQALKTLSSGSGTVIVQAPLIAITPSVSLDTIRYVGYASTTGIYISEFYDFFQSDGTTFISNDTLDNNANGNTAAFDQRLDTSAIPSNCYYIQPGIQITFTAAAQSVYHDAWTADDNLTVGVSTGGFFALMR